MKRAVISISSNIAEGYSRKSVKYYLHFYSIAYGFGMELETQLIICEDLKFGNLEMLNNCQNLLNEVLKMLNVMLFGKH